MFLNLKKLFFFTSYNICLFLILIIGTQNSSKKMKVDILLGKTVALPIGFTVGSSFIFGSLVGGIISYESLKKKD